MSAPGRPRRYRTNADRQKAYRKRQKIKVYHRHTCETWETPASIFAPLQSEFGFTLDAAALPHNAKCPHFYTPQDNALIQVWEGTVWLNPPYGRHIASWIHKAYESACLGATVVCLVPARTDTKWWHAYAHKGEIRFLPGRITFVGAAHPAPFPSAILIFHPTP